MVFMAEIARTSVFLLGVVFLTVASCQYLDSRRNPILLPEVGQGVFHAVGWTVLFGAPIFFGVGVAVLGDWRLAIDDGAQSRNAHNTTLVGTAIAVSTFAWGAHAVIPERWRDGYGPGILYLCTLLGVVCVAGVALLR
jgi:hypothetical protein